MQSELKSDCASLWPLVEELIKNDIDITAMRDATRGGVASVLNEWAKQSNICVEIDESKVPVSSEVRGICELLGFDAFTLANEGTFVLAVNKSDSDKAVALLKGFDIAQDATVIGTVTDRYKEKVILKSEWGTKRFLDLPTGELLPRIC